MSRLLAFLLLLLAIFLLILVLSDPDDMTPREVTPTIECHNMDVYGLDCDI